LSIFFLFRLRFYFHYIKHAKNDVKIKIFKTTRMNRFLCTKTNLLQKTMKKIWTWIKNDRLRQKFHKSFVKFEKNYFNLIFIIRQICNIKRMTKKNYVAYRNYLRIWFLSIQDIKFAYTEIDEKMCANWLYDDENSTITQKTIIYRLHHWKKKYSEKFYQQRRTELA
jgi:hypothetical protein